MPVRFDEPPASWLGGRPRKPARAEWPRSAAGRPLRFLAQVDCAAFPAALWGGLGPRKGWLLLFLDTDVLEDESRGRDLRVIHAPQLGEEREPPGDLAPLRPGMSGVWRRWPVDLVAQDDDAREMADGEPPVRLSLTSADRPLTWRGALCLVEGLRRALGADEYERRFVGSGGLIAPPVADLAGFTAEFARRCEALKEASADREPGWIRRLEPQFDALKADLAKEREAGWLARAHAVLRARREKLSEDIGEARRTLARPEAETPGLDRSRLEESVAHWGTLLEQEAEHEAHLNSIAGAFPEAGREAALAEEIRRSGAAHLGWAAERDAFFGQWHDRILAQEPDAPLPPEEWAKLRQALDETSCDYWRKTYDTRVLVKARKDLFSPRELETVIRDDVLYQYTRSAASRAALPPDVVAELEPQVRPSADVLSHRIGGRRAGIQDREDTGDVLLFQLVSDEAMGWMWGDMGVPNVEIDPLSLRLGRLGRARAWIDAH